MFNKRRRPGGNLQRWGMVLLPIAVFMAYALWQKGHDTGFIGIPICATLTLCFGGFAWIVPGVTFVTGLILVCEAADPRIIFPMSLGAACHLVLFSILFAQGQVGRGFWQTMVAMVGHKAAFYWLGWFTMALTIGMLGVSFYAVLAAVVRSMRRMASRVQQRVVPQEIEGPKVTARVFADDCASIMAEDVPAELELPREPVTAGYRLPSLDIFRQPVAPTVSTSNDQEKLVNALSALGVKVTFAGKERGPTVTRYELRPAAGLKLNKLTGLSDNIALALSAQSIRIEAPIPGRDVVGIEVPNTQRDEVYMRDMLASIDPKASLPVILGRDMSGKPVFGDLAKMPHVLVAGATGSGKSVCLNVLISSILSTRTPDEVQMLFIDPKRVELSPYNGIPHLIRPAITDVKQAAGALAEMTREMERRYKLLQQSTVRNIDQYNAKFAKDKLPFIVVVIDELAELIIQAKKETEPLIQSIAQLGRAAGIHLVIATQKPIADVITSPIKSNIPARIAFGVTCQQDSRTILDMNGAEALLGKGDMLYLPEDVAKPKRIQGANATNEELRKLVEHWLPQHEPVNAPVIDAVALPEASQDKDAIDDKAYVSALMFIERFSETRKAKASTSWIRESKFGGEKSMGHPRSVRIMDQLESLGIVGPNLGPKPRELLITSIDDLDEIFGRTRAEEVA
jgi:S-DNA-T family DNA segregation ATPase FtsK/SpoIIIE